MNLLSSTACSACGVSSPIVEHKVHETPSWPGWYTVSAVASDDGCEPAHVAMLNAGLEAAARVSPVNTDDMKQAMLPLLPRRPITVHAMLCPGCFAQCPPLASLIESARAVAAEYEAPQLHATPFVVYPGGAEDGGDEA